MQMLSMKINLFLQNVMRSQEANLFSVIPQALLLPYLLHEDPVDLHADLAGHLDGGHDGAGVEAAAAQLADSGEAAWRW